jgi:hypothetical protein
VFDSTLYTIISPNLLLLNTLGQEPRSSVQSGHDDKDALQVTHCLTSLSFVKFVNIPSFLMIVWICMSPSENVCFMFDCFYNCVILDLSNTFTWNLL